MKPLLKGAIIGAIIAVVYYFLIYTIEGLTLGCGIPLKGAMCGFITQLANLPAVLIFAIFFEIFQLRDLTGQIIINFVLPVINLILGLVVGALIGWIIGKIKSKKQ